MNIASQPSPADRHGIGGNEPPLEERVLLDFDLALGSHEGLVARLKEMTDKAEKCGPCVSDDEAGRYGDFIKMTSVAAKTIEAERETLNRPILNAGRALKARADNYAGQALAAGAKVRGHLDKYLADKETVRRAEEARLAEIARKAEAERQAIIRAAQQKAAQEAEVERRRLQKIADEEAAVERARLQKIEDERAAAEKREAEAIVVEADVVEVEPEPVFIPEPEPVFVQTVAPKQAVRGDYGTTVSTVETWHVEVLNIRQVPDVFLKDPAVLEALAKVLGPSVRRKNGLREIKGCRIWSTMGSAVR